MTHPKPSSTPGATIKSTIRTGRRIILPAGIFIGLGILRLVSPERDMEYTGLRALADHIFSTGLLGCVLFVAGGIGYKTLRTLRMEPSSYLETVVFAVPMGLGVLANGILALGLLGFLQVAFLLSWLLVSFAWSYQDCWALASEGWGKLRTKLHAAGRIGADKILLVVLLLLICCLSLIQALTPVWDYDALMYHINGPRIFLEAGKIYPLADMWQANGPFTTELLFILGLGFGSDTFAKLLHFSYAILLFLVTLIAGRRFLGKEKGWIAAVILVAIPIVPIWSALANADMGWAVYEFLGVYAMLLWIQSHRREWLALSGIMIGFSLGSKYLALGNAAALTLVVIWNGRKQGVKRCIQDLAMFGGFALIAGAPWYLKNGLWTGNPVYPLYFGGFAWPIERVKLLHSYLNSYGTGHRLIDYLSLPWNVYAHNEYFSTSGYAIDLPSILFILLILYPFVRHRKIIHILAAIVLIRLVVWAAGSQQIRFLLPAFPGLSLLVASILIGIDGTFLRERGGHIIRTGLLFGVTFGTLFISFNFLMIKPVGVIIGSESKQSFLNRILDIAPATTYIQNNLSPEEQALLMWEGRGYYCDSGCLPDAERGYWTYLAMTGNYDISLVTSELLSAGITHLLYIPGRTNFTLHNDPDGENIKATSFFMEFQEKCAELIYHDPVSSLYKITCQKRPPE